MDSPTMTPITMCPDDEDAKIERMLQKHACMCPSGAYLPFPKVYEEIGYTGEGSAADFEKKVTEMEAKLKSGSRVTELDVLVLLHNGKMHLSEVIGANKELSARFFALAEAMYAKQRSVFITYLYHACRAIPELFGVQDDRCTVIDEGLYAPVFMVDKMDMCRFLRSVAGHEPFGIVTFPIEKIEKVEELFHGWSEEKRSIALLQMSRCDDSFDDPELPLE